jgi:8-oxo-dGTP pyrophosphatase MutT (NUDIX family)
VKRERSAGLIVFRGRGGGREYLLVRSCRHGAWGFPKGHVRPGETNQAAARRETAEEARAGQIEIVPGFHRELRYLLPESGVRKEAVYFLARFAAGAEAVSADQEEVAELRWAGLEQALALITFANARELLQAAEEFLTKAGLSGES